MSTLPDIDPIFRSPYGWPKLPHKGKFGSVAHKNLRFKLHMFQNSKITRRLMLVLRFLASFSCVMRVVRCKQKGESFFFFYSYIIESLIGWVFNLLKSLTDRSRFFLRNCSVGGVGGPNKKESFRGDRFGEFGRGCWSEKKYPDSRSLEIGISAKVPFQNHFC